MVIDPCGCVWRGNPRDGYDLQTCAVHWLADMLEIPGLTTLKPIRGGWSIHFYPNKRNRSGLIQRIARIR